MPNPNNEEWWMDRQYWHEEKHPYGDTEVTESSEPLIEKIVAEAERRGKVNAYEDVLSAASQLRRDLQCMCAVKIPTCGCINDSFNEALDELGKAINEELIVTL